MQYITAPRTECKQQVIGGQSEKLQFTTPGQPQWQVCYHSIYELFQKPCSVFRFRSVYNMKDVWLKSVALYEVNIFLVLTVKLNFTVIPCFQGS